MGILLDQNVQRHLAVLVGGGGGLGVSAQQCSKHVERECVLPDEEVQRGVSCGGGWEWSIKVMSRRGRGMIGLLILKIGGLIDEDVARLID